MAYDGGVLTGSSPIETPLGLFLVQVLLVVSMTRILGFSLSYIGQPRVIAEVLGGIVLGPSVLGFLPTFSQTFFPKASIANLKLFANIGLILYLFLVGIELDGRAMVHNAKKSVLIAGAGMVLPFALGFAISPVLYDTLMAGATHKSVDSMAFSVFIAVAISITAFPVLARILNETHMLSTPVGNMSLSAAALDDVTAWCLLAMSIALIHASSPAIAAYIFLAVLAYAVFLLALVRPLWWKVVDLVETTQSHLSQSTLLAVAFLLLFASAWITELLGVHAIFGAFLFGLTMPRDHAFTLRMAEKIEDVTQIVFLPLYFAASGLSTDIGAVTDSKSLSMLGLVLLAAIGGKLVGCTVGSLVSGLKLRESLTVGMLMNTRGLVELIVLNVGKEAGVIDSRIFTIMVLMALITTFMTTPAVGFLYPPKHREYMNIAAVDGMDLLPTPSSKNNGAPGLRLAMVAQRFEEIPALASLIYMFHPAAAKGSLSVQALHFVDTSEAVSDYMMVTQAQGDHMPHPTLKSLKVCCQLVDAQIEKRMVVGRSDNFTEDLEQHLMASGADLLLVPWRAQAYFGWFDRFVHNSVSTCPAPMAILVEPEAVKHDSLNLSKGRRHVLFVLTSVGADLVCLSIAKRFSRNPNLNVTVLILDGEGPKNSAVESSIMSLDITKITKVALKGAQITSQALTEEARRKPYDFVFCSYTLDELASAPAQSLPTCTGHPPAAMAPPHLHDNSHKAAHLLGTTGRLLADALAQASTVVVIHPWALMTTTKLTTGHTSSLGLGEAPASVTPLLPISSTSMADDHQAFATMATPPGMMGSVVTVVDIGGARHL